MNRRVLIVDDDPNLVKSLTFVFNKEGFTVNSASDGEDALMKVRQSKPDLMFLDIMMPRKNGYEVCQEIKNTPELSDIYVIMLTAKGQEMDREKARTVNVDEFVTKPFSPIAMVEKVKILLPLNQD